MDFSHQDPRRGEPREDALRVGEGGRRCEGERGGDIWLAERQGARRAEEMHTGRLGSGQTKRAKKV